MPGQNSQEFDWGANSEMDSLPSEEEAAAIEADDSPQVQENPAESVVAEIYEEAPKPQRIDRALERIQKVQERLDIAACYRLLLNGSMFDTNTPATQKVESEIRDFVCQRLDVLMGVAADVKVVSAVDPVKAVFSESEIQLIKALVKAAAKKLSAVQAPKEAEPPAPVAPTLKKVVNEAPVKPQPPPAPAVPQPAPQQRRQFQQPQLRRQQPQQQPQSQVTAVGRVVIDDARIPPQHRDDPTLKLTPDGKVMVQARDPDGKPMWEFNPATKKFDKPFYKNVALPARADPNSGSVAKPMPTTKEGIAQFMGPGSPLMQQHADSMLVGAERRANKMGLGNQFAGTVVRNLDPNAVQTSDDEEGEFRP